MSIQLQTVAAAACVLALASSQALAEKIHVTAAEKAACASDAIRLCLATYPDEDRMLSCMKDNRSQLSTLCRVTFDAGLRRRHLSLR